MNHNAFRNTHAALVLIWVIFLILTTATNSFSRPYLYMEKPQLGLGFIYEFDNEKQINPGVNFESQRHEFRERLDIETRGWIYHPNFWQYDFDLKPEWAQRMEEDNTNKGSKSVFLQGYFLNTTFLPYKPYSLSLFGRKQNIPALSAFSKVSDTDIESFGASLNLSYPVLPTTLSFVRNKEERTGFYSSKEDNKNWRLQSRHRKGSSATQLNGSYEEIRSSSEGVLSSVDSLSGSIDNNYSLEEKKISFRTALSQRLTDRNTVSNSTFQFNEDINWEHRKNLTTNYYVTYNANTSGDAFSDSRNLGARLKHLLYENLTTDLSAGIEKKEFTGGSENNYKGQLAFNYRRPIPWGTFGANMGFTYELRSKSFDQDFIPVIDEPLALIGYNYSYLEKKYADIETVKVTDISGTKIYIKNLDYEVDEINYFARIRRLVGSDIADGEQVLVSYSYLSTSPSYDDSILGQSYGMNLNLWSMLFLSYDYRQSKQRLISGIPPDELEDDKEHNARIELLWRFTDTIFSYKNSDRTAGNSIEEWQLDEVLTFRPAANLFCMLTGTVGHSEFKKDVDEKQDIYGFGFNIDWLPLSWGKLGLSGSRYIVSGDSTETEETAFTAIFEMSYLIWTGSLKYSYLLRNDNIIDETREISNIVFEIVRAKF